MGETDGEAGEGVGGFWFWFDWHVFFLLVGGDGGGGGGGRFDIGKLCHIAFSQESFFSFVRVACLFFLFL